MQEDIAGGDNMTRDKAQDSEESNAEELPTAGDETQGNEKKDKE